ncbi:MAG: hypothetical protein ACRES8_09125, partial [Nevskiaceae bacterium]
ALVHLVRQRQLLQRPPRLRLDVEAAGEVLRRGHRRGGGGGSRGERQGEDELHAASLRAAAGGSGDT